MMIALVLLLQEYKPPLVQQQDVDAAIKRGKEWLLTTAALGAGEPPYHEGRSLTYDGLMLYTLMHAGADKKHAAVQKLIRAVREAAPTRTYNAAMNALALQAVDRKAYKKEIAACAQFLADTQCENGQWGYGEAGELKPPDVSGDAQGTQAQIVVKRNKSRTREAHGDNSNTQYAALGIWACSRAGIEMDPQVLDQATKWWENCQRPDGGWGYNEGGKFDERTGVYGSMTAGGAGSLVILRRLRGKDAKTGAVNRGLDWLAKNWAVDKNPNADSARNVWHFYYLYALERVGDMLGVEKVGKWVWYPEGAAWLLKNQNGGTWGGAEMRMTVADTCFAILFLERAMRVATGVEEK